MKPGTLVSYYAFNQVPKELPLPLGFQDFPPSKCRDRFQKYQAWVHFKMESHKYVVSLNFLTPKDIKIKGYIYAFYEDLG